MKSISSRKLYSNSGGYSITKVPECWSWWVIMFLGVCRVISVVIADTPKGATMNKIDTTLWVVVFLFIHHVIFSWLCYKRWHIASWALILIPMVISIMITSFVTGVVMCRKDLL